MTYEFSNHYREDPREEINAALEAGNPPESVLATIEARRDTESRRRHPNMDAITRTDLQIAYVSGFIVSSEYVA